MGLGMKTDRLTFECCGCLPATITSTDGRSTRPWVHSGLMQALELIAEHLCQLSLDAGM